MCNTGSPSWCSLMTLGSGVGVWVAGEGGDIYVVMTKSNQRGSRKEYSLAHVLKFSLAA